MNRRSGQSFTVNVDSSTVFEDFERGGLHRQSAGLQLRQDGPDTGGQTKRKRHRHNAGQTRGVCGKRQQQAIKGTITSVDSSTQFHMVVSKKSRR